MYDLKVKESERVEALREWAWIIVEAELTHPSWHRYHRYIHIAEAADDSSEITGWLKQLFDNDAGPARRT